jgi:hypothetical protein
MEGLGSDLVSAFGPYFLATLNAIQLGLLVWLRKEQSRVKKELKVTNGKINEILQRRRRGDDSLPRI